MINYNWISVSVPFTLLVAAIGLILRWCIFEAIRRSEQRRLEFLAALIVNNADPIDHHPHRPDSIFISIPPGNVSQTNRSILLAPPRLESDQTAVDLAQPPPSYDEVAKMIQDAKCPEKN